MNSLHDQFLELILWECCYVFSSKMVNTRKEHECHWCGGLHPKAELMRVDKFRDPDGMMRTEYTCCLCLHNWLKAEKKEDVQWIEK